LLGAIYRTSGVVRQLVADSGATKRRPGGFTRSRAVVQQSTLVILIPRADLICVL